MIQGVVFDLDHTLFDRYGTLRKVLPIFYANYRSNIPADLSEEAFIEQFILSEKQCIHFGWHKLLQNCTDAGILVGIPEDAYREVAQYILRSCWTADAVPYPFTEPALRELRNMGYKLGIITNGSHDVQAKKIHMLGLESLVDEIIISGDIGIHKPNPEPFILMSQRLNIPPQELIYVGDNPVNDVAGSRNAGYTSVWVKATGHWAFDEIPRAQYEVDTVAQIPELVKYINAK